MSIYVTFCSGDKKFAAKCKDMDEAIDVARDANSLVYVKNVRINKSGRFKGRVILNCDEYFNGFFL